MLIAAMPAITAAAKFCLGLMFLPFLLSDYVIGCLPGGMQSSAKLQSRHIRRRRLRAHVTERV
jgi:hypothetical protein